MTVDNEENRKKNQNFDEKHRFVKGNTISKGKRKRTQTDKLISALKKVGEKRGENFWEVVADRAFINKDIMKAVVNKLVPTVSELTGLGGEPLNINLIEKTYGEEGEKGKSEEAKT